MNKKLFWLSWNQPTADYRPMSFPPDKSVLGWWCTGVGGLGHSICAYVVAETEDQAKAIIQIDWPEAQEWRFCEKREQVRINSRLPESDWMIERLDSWR